MRTILFVTYVQVRHICALFVTYVPPKKFVRAAQALETLAKIASDTVQRHSAKRSP
jgi:hypothetical protein